MDSYVQINLYNSFREWEGRSPYVLKTDTAYYILVNTNFSEGKNKILNVFFNGYYESYKIEPSESFSKSVKYFRPYFVDVKNQTPSKWGYKAKHFMTAYMAYSMFVPMASMGGLDYRHFDRILPNLAKSHRFDIGIRYKYNICKWYAIGGNFEWSITKLHHKQNNLMYMTLPYQIPKYNKNVYSDFRLEFFQRFRLASISVGDIYFDLGAYGIVNISSKNKILYKCKGYNAEEYEAKVIYKMPSQGFGYGLKARLGYGFIAIFAQCESFPNERNNYNFINFGVELSIPY